MYCFVLILLRWTSNVMFSLGFAGFVHSVAGCMHIPYRYKAVLHTNNHIIFLWRKKMCTPDAHRGKGGRRQINSWSNSRKFCAEKKSNIFGWVIKEKTSPSGCETVNKGHTHHYTEWLYCGVVALFWLDSEPPQFSNTLSSRKLQILFHQISNGSW